MLTDIYKPPDKHDHERFNKEILFFSYIAHKVAEQSKANGYSITKLTKIGANYVQDWGRVFGSSGDYVPYMGITPNPYGMVAAIPKTIAGRPLFIYELHSVAKNKNLWNIIEDDHYRQVVMLSDSNTLKDKLLKVDKETDFDFKFTPQELGVASFLSKLYSKFSTLELNILASHRDKINSQKCMGYAFRVWETNYQEIIPNLIAPEWDLASDMSDKILKMAVSCEQIELKTDYNFNGIQGVADKLENVSDGFGDLERTIIDTMVDKIRKESQFNIENASFNEQYLLNREYIYPITNALIDIFNMHFLGDLISEKRKQINQMKKALEKPSIIETSDKPVEIDYSEDPTQILQNIEHFHNEAVKRSGGLLRPFPKSDENSSPGQQHDEKTDWIITDGREDMNAN